MKNILAVVILMSIILMNSAFASSGNGKVIMVVTIEVENFTEWKKMFDEGASVREKAGIKVLSICNSSSNENKVIVIEEAVNITAADNFISFLKSKQKKGDMAKMDVKIYDKVD